MCDTHNVFDQYTALRLLEMRGCAGSELPLGVSDSRAPADPSAVHRESGFRGNDDDSVRLRCGCRFTRYFLNTYTNHTALMMIVGPYAAYISYIVCVSCSQLLLVDAGWMAAASAI